MRLLRFLLYWIGIGVLVITAALTLARRDDPQPAWIFFASGPDYGDVGTLYRMPLGGSGAKDIVAEQISVPVESLPSPDGDWMVVRSQNRYDASYYIMRSDGRDFRPISPISNSSVVTDPVWSADSKWLVFTVSRGDVSQSDLYRLSPQEDRLKRLTDSPGNELFYQWSSDGQWILYISNRDGSQHLYRMRPDGTEQQLVEGMPISIQCENWKHDEAWMRSTFGEAFVMELYRTLPNGLLDSWCTTWTPDEQWIIFSAGNFRTTQYFRTRRDGSEVQVLTTDPERGFRFAAWSPDNDWIVFQSWALNSTDYNVHTMHPDGSHATQITDWPSTEYFRAWSPDGEWLIFHSLHGLVDDIYRVRPDGSGLQRLNDAPNSYSLIWWSPDGEWMILLSSDDTHDLYRMRLDGSQHQRLTNSPGYDYVTTWTPDGKWMLVDSQRSGNGDLYRMRPDGSHVERLTNTPLDDYFLAWSPVINLAWHNGLLSGIALSLIVMARWLGIWQTRLC